MEESEDIWHTPTNPTSSGHPTPRATLFMGTRAGPPRFATAHRVIQSESNSETQKDDEVTNPQTPPATSSDEDHGPNLFVIYFSTGGKNTIRYSPDKLLLPLIKHICAKKGVNWEAYRIQNSDGEFIEIKENDTLGDLPGRSVILCKSFEYLDPYLKYEGLGMGLIAHVTNGYPRSSTDPLVKSSFKSDPFKQLMKKNKRRTKKDKKFTEKKCDGRKRNYSTTFF